MKKLIISMILIGSVSAFAAEETIVCLTETGKDALVTMTSDTIRDDRVYANFLGVKTEGIEDEGLNIELKKDSEMAHYIRNEGNGDLPVVLLKLSTYKDDYDALSIMFTNEALTEAELVYYNLDSELQIKLAQLKCE